MSAGMGFVTFWTFLPWGSVTREIIQARKFRIPRGPTPHREAFQQVAVILDEVYTHLSDHSDRLKRGGL